MKKADGTGKRILYAILLASSAVLVLLTVVLSVEPPNRIRYAASGRPAEISPLMPMAENWLLNAGNADALDELPGIGETLSRRIIETRETDGDFFFPEDVMAVRGIGEKTMADIVAWLEAHPEKAYVYPED